MANNLEKLTRTLSVSIPTKELQQLVDLIVELSERGEIRIDTTTGCYSLYDTIQAVTGVKNPRKTWNDLLSRYSDTVSKSYSVKLPRKDGKLANRESPVADFPSLIEIVWLLPGKFSDKLRKASAKIVSTIIEQVKTPEPTQQLTISPEEIANLNTKMDKLTEGFEWLKNENQQLKDTNTKLEVVAKFFAEHRIFCENDAPGIVKLFDYITEYMQNVPLKTIEFTASEWLYKNARHMSEYRKRRFYLFASGLYKAIVGKEPESYNGCRIYSNRTEFILKHSLNYVNGSIPTIVNLGKELILDAASEQIELDLKTPEYEAYPNIPGLELI